MVPVPEVYMLMVELLVLAEGAAETEALDGEPVADVSDSVVEAATDVLESAADVLEAAVQVGLARVTVVP